MQMVLPCKQLACLRQEWSELSSPSGTTMGCWALGTKGNVSCVAPAIVLCLDARICQVPVLPDTL